MVGSHIEDRPIVVDETEAFDVFFVSKNGQPSNLAGRQVNGFALVRTVPHAIRLLDRGSRIDIFGDELEPAEEHWHA